MGRSRLAAGIGLLVVLGVLAPYAGAQGERPVKFERVSTQFIAALGDPAASAGSGAEAWGIWRIDPGPRGVRLDRFETLKASGVAPARWKFDATDWWVEEHGLIMESPEFPLPPGKYVVTGDREVTTVLTIHPKDANGTSRWELADGARLHDVTHLPCRSARYTSPDGTCAPGEDAKRQFPVKPGAEMPPIAGCAKQDYAVLFIVGVAVEE